MRNIVYYLLLILSLAGIVGCGGKKRDAAYYERLVDSVRRAEQAHRVAQQAGIDANPVVAYFDTLRRHSLPIRSEDGEWGRLGRMVPVPKAVGRWLGYPDDADLRALQLPSVGGRGVVLLSETVDSLTETLFLCTLDAEHHVLDDLCIYEEYDEERSDDTGRSYMEFFITSDYEVTLMRYFRSPRRPSPEFQQVFRYVIDSLGHFEEVIVPLDGDGWQHDGYDATN